MVVQTLRHLVLKVIISSSISINLRIQKIKMHNFNFFLTDSENAWLGIVPSTSPVVESVRTLICNFRQSLDYSSLIQCNESWKALFFSFKLCRLCLLLTYLVIGPTRPTRSTGLNACKKSCCQRYIPLTFTGQYYWSRASSIMT